MSSNSLDAVVDFNVAISFTNLVVEESLQKIILLQTTENRKNKILCLLQNSIIREL
jgi:hypothetical protein